MLGKNNPQIDVFTHMIFDRLIPEDHLLVLINSIIDFICLRHSKRKYSDIGRKSESVMMLRSVCWNSYTLYQIKGSKENQTDIALLVSWFIFRR